MFPSDYLWKTWKIIKDGRFRVGGSNRIFKGNSKEICKDFGIVKSFNKSLLSCYPDSGTVDKWPSWYFFGNIVTFVYIGNQCMFL